MSQLRAGHLARVRVRPKVRVRVRARVGARLWLRPRAGRRGRRRPRRGLRPGRSLSLGVSLRSTPRRILRPRGVSRLRVVRHGGARGHLVRVRDRARVWG